MEKTFDIPEGLVPKYEELLALERAAYDLNQDLKRKGGEFWAEIERTYDLRGKPLKLDKDTRKIMVVDKSQMPPAQTIPGRLNAAGKPVPIKINKDEMGTALPKMTEQKEGAIGRIKNAIGL